MDERGASGAVGGRMFERILVGLDGSEPSMSAVQTAGRLAAEQEGRELILCFVVPPAPIFVDAAALTLVEFDRRAEEEGRSLLTRARADLPMGVPVTDSIVHGPAASSLLDEAKGRACDLIVLGSHGRTAFRRFLLGSVAMQVVAHADIPVLVVH